MKRIVHGVTYNTGTSTRLACKSWEETTLRPGLGPAPSTKPAEEPFFVHHESTVREWNEAEREYHERERHEFDEPHGGPPVDAEGRGGGFRQPFDDPPEAAAEAEQGGTSTFVCRWL